MKRQPGVYSFVFLLSAFIGIGNPTSAATIPPIKHPKRQISIVRTECKVVATEAKRLAPALPQADPFSRELWSLISENVNTLGVLDIFHIIKGRDVLSNGVAPSGVGWRSDFLDGVDENRNQRHHFGFYLFTGAAAETEDQIVALIGGGVNNVLDLVTGNIGDVNLALAANGIGNQAESQSNTFLVTAQVKGQLCTP